MNWLEIRRGLLHIFCGVLGMVMLLYLPYAKLIFLGLFLVGICMMICSRKYKITGIAIALCTFERKCNKNYPGKGLLFFVLSGLLVSVLFPVNIALASIAILTFGDPIAGIIGREFGRIKVLNKNKHLEGRIVAVIVTSMIAGLFVTPLMAVMGASFGMLFELIEIHYGKNGKLDDNLVVPLVSGAVMWLIAL